MIYLTKGLLNKQYTQLDGLPDFSHLVKATGAPQEALKMTDEQLAGYKSSAVTYALYGTVNGQQRRDDVLNRTVLFIDVDDESDYHTLSDCLANMFTALGINFVIYPTISNGIKYGARLRVGIELDKAVELEVYRKIWLVITHQLHVKGDITAINGSFKQLQGLYVKTSQNALNKPIITTDGAGLPVDKFVAVYDKNAGKYQLKKAHESGKNIDTIGKIPTWAEHNRKFIACLLDPESNYMMFGGWDNMLTALGGWTLRSTCGDYGMTADVLEAVNNMGSDPISDSELGKKFKSWAKGWTY
ncbi:hypothetical protein [Weissella paramesenteroides]|uniref:hypothetical protein n=1 Tax=Weissella paramesenteroides TaxID=1249 RepID=UPI00103EA2C5|nr:hypothetical protein [Weissella paramesenteroides]RZQ58526.1 hypothetical protein EWR19_05415 [Weissella paramesenteroides]